MLKIIITLFISWLAILTVQAYDSGKSYMRADPVNKIKIDSLVEHTSFEENMAQLLWFYQDSDTEYCLHPAGVVNSSPTIKQASGFSDFRAYNILDITNGFEDSSTGRLLFPNQITRKAARATTYKHLNQLYTFDFWLDIPKLESNPMYYGVSFDSLQARLHPFYSADSLYESLLNFDQVLWVSSCEMLDTLVSKENYRRKQIRSLKNKVKAALSDRQRRTEQFSQRKLINKADWVLFEEWKWLVNTQSITLAQSKAVVPLEDLEGKTVCSYVFEPEIFNIFNKTLSYYGPMQYYEANKDYLIDVDRLKDYDYVIVPVQTWSRDKTAFLKELNNHTQIIVVDFNPTNNIVALPTDISYMMAWEMNETTKTITAQSIFGAYAITGTFPTNGKPMNVSSTLPIGRLKYTPPSAAKMDEMVLKHIDEVVNEAITLKAFPGCQILIAHEGKVVFNKNYGYNTYDSLASVETESIYDLASLTKVLATTQAVMFLEERGLIDLNMSIGHYLPELQGSNKEFMSIREIMTHQAGLFPYLPFWAQTLSDRKLENALTNSPKQNYFQVGRGLFINESLTDSIMSWSIKSSLIEKEDEEIAYEYKYSDIGFYLMKALVEKIINQPIDEFLDQNLYGPMRMGTVFRPLCQYPEDIIVPTESDNAFRKELLQGFVHDRNAALFDGVSGHAGLFGNAIDIAKLLQMHLQEGTYGNKQYYFPETIKRFTGKQYVNNRRGLGWDKPGPEPDGPVSTLASNSTFGHTGFTGTAIWADPQENLIFIFLSNRVYPSSDNLKLVELNIRTRIQDLAYGSIIIDH